VSERKTDFCVVVKTATKAK